MSSFSSNVTIFVVLVIVGVRHIVSVDADRSEPESQELTPYTDLDISVEEIDNSAGTFPLRWEKIQQVGRTSGRLEAYTSEIESKMRGLESPEDFLHIFFPNGNLDSIWNDIVNSSFYQVVRSGRNRDGSERDVYREDDYSETMSDELREGLTRHMHEVSCIRPKPVLIDMYQEMNITRDRPIYILPECTMLMRCQNGECCRRVRPCVPREGTRQLVTRSFMITEIQLQTHPNEVLEPSPRIRLFNYTFYQDTICDCLGPSNQPSCELTCKDANKKLNTKLCQCECLKRCPIPYVLDEDTCSCDCVEENNDCKKVKRGKRSIKPRECSCISSGKCYTPPCKAGMLFSSCRCVKKQRNVKKSNRRRRIDDHSSSSRGRFGGDTDEEPIHDSLDDCVTESTTQNAGKDFTKFGTTRGRMGVASLRTHKPPCVDKSSEDKDSDEEEASGYIPPF